MQSLTDLNSHSRTIIEVADSRPSGVVLDRNTAAIQDQKVEAAVNMTVPTAVDILEIINYATADVRFKITIVTPSPALSPTSISWAVIPAGLTLTTSGQEYTISGIKTAAEWNLIKNPTWIIPSGYATKPIWYLTSEIIWYDSSLGEDQSVSWDTYDTDFYYNAKLESVSSLSCTIFKKNGTGASLSAVSSVFCVTGDNLFSNFTLTCTPKQYIGVIANLSVTASTLTVGITTNLKLGYTLASAGSITINLSGVTNAIISWGDGTTTTATSNGDFTKSYASSGSYNVNVSGTYTGFWNKSPNLRRVYSFPLSGLTAIRGLGYGLLEIPNELPSSITNLSYCFNPEYDTSSSNHFNLNTISNWNTQNVTNMSYIFANNKAFSQNLNTWNVSNVNDMSGAFYNSTYNQSLSNWNTQSVTNMTLMFAGSGANVNAFNQDISAWNVTNVTNMSYMFQNSSFNQTIGIWNVVNVQTFRRMFESNQAFNQPLNSWNIIGASDLTGMFENSIYNQPLNSWATQNVVYMGFMFSGSGSSSKTAFNQPLSNWNTEKVIDMGYMFQYSVFNQPIPRADNGKWNTLRVRYSASSPQSFGMNYMFRGNTNFDQDISNWNVALIPSKPTGFDTSTNASWTTAEKPVWGTNP